VLRHPAVVGQGKATQWGVSDDNGDDDEDTSDDYIPADGDNNAVDSTVRDPDNGTHNDGLNEMLRDEREPYNLPLPESAITLPFYPGTVPDNLPAPMTDNLSRTHLLAEEPRSICHYGRRF
jgi:hypothetical protein